MSNTTVLSEVKSSWDKATIGLTQQEKNQLLTHAGVNISLFVTHVALATRGKWLPATYFAMVWIGACHNSSVAVAGIAKSRKARLAPQTFRKV